jgi:predicted nucleotidyltransferase
VNTLDRLPPDVRAQLDRLVVGLRAVLGEDLVGVYLHGSLVLGCFNPQRSDVDVLAVTSRRCAESEHPDLEAVLQAASGPKEWPRTAPYPVEISFLAAADLRSWRYPTPYELHFSQTVGLVGPGDDHDLAAHITILREAGVTLTGSPIAEVFPIVPNEDFLDSLRRDLAWCREQRWKFYSLLSAS